MKPENILVAASGHLRLTDFDLSQKADAAATPIQADEHGIGVSQKVHDMLLAQHEIKRAAVTAGGVPEDALNYARFDSFVGTIEYMAPEVVQGTGHSFTVDWWVYGCMLFEMVTGVTPFRGKDAKATFEKILYSEPTWTHPLCLDPKPRISKELKELIGKLLVKKQDKRLGYDKGASAIKLQPWFCRELTLASGSSGSSSGRGTALTGAETPVANTGAEATTRVGPVRWDLLRNEKPPLLPPPKPVDKLVHDAPIGTAVASLKPLQEIFDELDLEERTQLAEKEASAKEAAAKNPDEQQKPAPAPKPETQTPEGKAAAARTAAMNAPERLAGFVFDARDRRGNDRRDAYGADETGTAR